jgi:phospholipid/cholesterol/gamma-HCH transport system ATP-binding protein
VTNSSQKNLVEVRNVHFIRGTRPIYSGIDIDIRRGKLTAILGPSGSGKTTLLQLIGGQLKPASGSLKFDGLEVANLRRKQLFELRKRLGMLFQSGALLTDLSVFDNVAYPLREHSGKSEQEIFEIVLHKLESVGLRNARDLMPDELSGGMKRRVALARAIALDPELIMYDEPFTGQDPISMGVLIRLLREMNTKPDITSVVVSHDVAEVLSIADYVYIISGAEVVAQGTPDEVRNSDSPWVQQFVNGEADGPAQFHYPGLSLEDDLKSGHK